MTATQFLAGMDKKICDEAFACMSSYPTNTGSTFAQDYGTSASQCYAQAATAEMPSEVESEITAGKIHFDASAAEMCLAGVAFADCASFWSNGPNLPASCSSALVGTVPDGGACVVDYDCSNEQSICDPSTSKCGPASAGSAAPVDPSWTRSMRPLLGAASE